MPAQLCLFAENLVKTPKKRIRYKIPTYRKFEKINKNIKEYKANQKHIFRLKALHNIFAKIADEIFCGQQKLHLGDWRLFKDGVVIYFDEYGNQAEVQGFELLPIYKRLKIHIELLRRLRQGVKIKKAVKIARKARK